MDQKDTRYAILNHRQAFMAPGLRFFRNPENEPSLVDCTNPFYADFFINSHYFPPANLFDSSSRQAQLALFLQEQWTGSGSLAVSQIDPLFPEMDFFHPNCMNLPKYNTTYAARLNTNSLYIQGFHNQRAFLLLSKFDSSDFNLPIYNQVLMSTPTDSLILDYSINYPNSRYLSRMMLGVCTVHSVTAFVSLGKWDGFVNFTGGEEKGYYLFKTDYLEEKIPPTSNEVIDYVLKIYQNMSKSSQ